jgi:hypothetical protein
MDSISTQESRAEIVRTVKSKPSRLRAATSNTIMAVIGAAALTPIVATGIGAGPIALAVAGVVGSVGAGQLTTLVQRCADRIRGQNSGTSESDLHQVIQQAIQTEIAAELDRSDAEAERLLAELVQFVQRVDGFETALNSAAGELHDHLRTEFSSLEGRTGDILDSLADIEYGQKHLIDRFDEFEKRYSQGPGQSAQQSVPARDLNFDPYDYPVPPVVIASPEPQIESFAPGADITIGRERYLLYERQTAELLSPDNSMRLETALAQRIAPTRNRGIRFVWLRRIRRQGSGLMARAAESGLRREHELLNELSEFPRTAYLVGRALPWTVHLEVDGTTTTSALSWPLQRNGTVPCDGLDSLVTGDGRPLSKWALAELCTGLAGLCSALSLLHRRGISHRDLTLEGVLLTESQRLALRDLGKAGNAPVPGETQSPYAAPEQRRRGETPPGSHTDVYQLSALTYHLVSGYLLPHVPALPLESMEPGLPVRLSTEIDKALSARPSERPTARALGDAFRAAAGQLA